MKRHEYDKAHQFFDENIKEDEILNNYGSGNSAVDNFIKACRRYQSAQSKLIHVQHIYHKSEYLYYNCSGKDNKPLSHVAQNLIEGAKKNFLECIDKLDI